MIIIREIPYSFRFIIIFFFKMCPVFSNYSMFNCSNINSFFFFFFFKKCPTTTNYFIFNYSVFNFFFFSIKRFLMLLIMFSSDCFCVFGLLRCFSLPCTNCLGVFILKRFTTLSLKPPTIFLIGWQI